MAPSQTVYADIQAYLEGIANNPNDARDVDNASHGRFWTVTYSEFITGVVPNQKCNGAPVPIVDADPAKCPFHQALTGASGFCLRGQMPRMGPFITDPAYEVTLADGKKVSGAEIESNIAWWLANGMPEA